ncbi:MAG: ATP-binding cassette domain-containing protein [Thermodesulfobacteriota bacterium]|nr:ATP-binding cassette domain-containing protein [Thermodesulfobacteriota bacterium]
MIIAARVLIATMAKNKSVPVIDARNLTRIYTLGHREVISIDNIYLDIAPGELVVLKGNSGSGKSTLLSLIAGLDCPTQGYLTVADYDLTKATPSELTYFRREVVGMVFQSFNLMPTLNVLENACLPGLLAGKSADRMKSKARELLEWLGLGTRWNQFGKPGNENC